MTRLKFNPDFIYNGISGNKILSLTYYTKAEKKGAERLTANLFVFIRRVFQRLACRPATSYALVERLIKGCRPINISTEANKQKMRTARYLFDLCIQGVNPKKAAEQRKAFGLEEARVLLTLKEEVKIIPHVESSKKNPVQLIKAEAELLRLIRREPDAFKRASPELLKNRKLMLEIVKENPKLFKDFDKDLTKDKEIIEIALKGSVLNFKHIHKDLQNDEPYVLELVTRNGLLYSQIKQEFRKKMEFVVAAVTSCGLSLYDMPDYQNHFGVVLNAVIQNALALQHTDKRLRNHIAIGLAAAKNQVTGSLSVQYMGEDLQDNEEVILAALYDKAVPDDSLLKWAGPNILKSKPFFKKIVKDFPKAFRYADLSLRSDEPYILELIKIAGKAILETVHSELLKKTDFILEVYRLKPSIDIIRLLDGTLQTNLDFLVQIVEKTNRIDMALLSNQKMESRESLLKFYERVLKLDPKPADLRDFLLYTPFSNDESFRIELKELKTKVSQTV